MRTALLGYALLGALLAALGQLSFKLGADGRSALAEFANPGIALGLLLYLAGTVAWIRALSALPLTVLYPFTALTFVLVHVLAVTVLGEPWSSRTVAGTLLVLAGLFLVIT